MCHKNGSLGLRVITSSFSSSSTARRAIAPSATLAPRHDAKVGGRARERDRAR
jgi:hypothetical protein